MFAGDSSKTVGAMRNSLISCVDDLLRQEYLVKGS